MESDRSSGCAFTFALHSFKYGTTMNFIKKFTYAANILKDSPPDRVTNAVLA